MAKDLFTKPFDEGTLSKLSVFEDYFKEWLPVFISKQDAIWKHVQIFDFFAGEGKDVNGVDGSPTRILKTLNLNRQQIINNKIKITVILNEYEEEKFDLLQQNTTELWDKQAYELKLVNKDFKDVFDSHYVSMQGSANFLFLDQNGIKQITEDVFRRLVLLKQTDFLFFISSSYLKRFAELDEFNKYLKITKQDFQNKSYYHSHRIVLSYYRSLSTSNYFLAPFSIKKPSGVFGLIFGSSHSYGIEKFLRVCWKHDQITGEANFDIDNEKIDLNKPTLFEQYNIPSKRQVFEAGLRNLILETKLRSDYDVYLHTLNEGFLFKDANKILKELKNEHKISFEFKMISTKMHQITSPQEIQIL